MNRVWSRRYLLRAGIGAAGGVLWTHGAAASRTAPRVAALGWACAQSLLALGVVPLVAPEIERYGRLVVEPAMPSAVLEAGLRSEPNLERLQRLAPDLIVIDPTLAPARARLEQIAPVIVFGLGSSARRAYERAQDALRALAARVGLESACAAYLDRVETGFERAARRLRGYSGGPLYIVGELLGPRMLVFGGTSIYQDMLDRFGLRNAWSGDTSVWGHATVGVDRLAAVPDARLVLLSSRVGDLGTLLASRPLYRSLPFMREDRITILSEILFYGGVPSAERFVRLLADRLPGTGDERG